MILSGLSILALISLSQAVPVQSNKTYHQRLPKFSNLHSFRPRSIRGKTLLTTHHAFFMENVSTELIPVDLSPEHRALLENQGIPTDNLKWIHNHTHIFDNPQYVYHSDFSSYGLIVNRIDLSFNSWDWQRQEAKFTADTYGLALGTSKGGGTCWLNYSAGWLADNNWGANAWSMGGGDVVGAMNIIFSGGSEEAIGTCLYGIAGLQVSYSSTGWGNFHH